MPRFGISSIASFLAVLILGPWQCSSAFAQPATSNAGSTKAEQNHTYDTTNDRNFDFGRVRIGQPQEHRFQLTNNTSRQWNIRSVATSCGCVKASVNEKKLAAGASTELVVVPQTANFRGKKTASIHVRFGGPPHEIKFSVAINISNFSISPGEIGFSHVLKDAAQSTEFQIQNFNDANWKIEKVSSSSADLSVAVSEPKENQPPSKRTLVCTFDNRSGIDVPRSEQLVVYTSDLREPKIIVPVKIRPAAEPIRCSVEKLMFTPEDLKVLAKKRLLLLTAELSELSAVKFSHTGFKAREIEPGRKTTHIIEVQPTGLLEDGSDESAERSSDDGNQTEKITSLQIQTQSGLTCEVQLHLRHPINSETTTKPPKKAGFEVEIMKKEN